MLRLRIRQTRRIRLFEVNLLCFLNFIASFAQFVTALLTKSNHLMLESKSCADVGITSYIGSNTIPITIPKIYALLTRIKWTLY